MGLVRKITKLRLIITIKFWLNTKEVFANWACDPKCHKRAKKNIACSWHDLHILNSSLYIKWGKKVVGRIRSIFKPDQAAKKNLVTRDSPVEGDRKFLFDDHRASSSVAPFWNTNIKLRPLATSKTFCIEQSLHVREIKMQIPVYTKSEGYVVDYVIGNDPSISSDNYTSCGAYITVEFHRFF